MDPSVGGLLGFKEGWLIMLGYMLLAVVAAICVYRKKLARMVI